MTDLKLNLNDVESNNQEEPLMNGQINIKDDKLMNSSKNNFSELHHIVPNQTGKIEKIIKNSQTNQTEEIIKTDQKIKNDNKTEENLSNNLKNNQNNFRSNKNEENANILNLVNQKRGGRAGERRVSYKFLPKYDALKILNIDGQNSRCSECLYIPFIGVKNVNGKAVVETLCRNKHKQEIEIKEFMEQSQLNVFQKIICTTCNNKITKDNLPFKFCFNENGFICNNCVAEHNMHNVVNLNEIDSFSSETCEKFEGFCITEKKNYCGKEEKKTHDNFKYDEVMINSRSLENLIKKLAIAKKQIGDIEGVKTSMINNLQNVINEIERNFKIYKETNLNVISLFEDLIDTYKNRLNDKNFSFEIIKNVKNCLKFNFVEFKPSNPKDLNESVNFLKFLKNSSNNIFQSTKINIAKYDEEDVDKDILKNIAKDPLIEKRNLLYIPEKKSNDYIGNILLLKNNKLLCFTRKEDKNFYRIFETNLKEYKDIPLNIGVSNYYMIQLNDEHLVVINENNILLLKLNENEGIVKVAQELKSHEANVKKVIQLKNGNLVSCDEKGDIKFWNLRNNIDYDCFHTISAFEAPIESILEIPYTNELVSTCESLGQFKYYNLSKMENTCIYSDIKCNNYREKLILITDKILAAAGNKYIYLFDVVTYKKVQKISCYTDVIKIERLRDNTILTFGKNGATFYFEQWVIYNDKIKRVSKYKFEEKDGQIEYFTLNAKKNITLCNYINQHSYLFELK